MRGGNVRGGDVRGGDVDVIREVGRNMCGWEVWSGW